MTVTESLQSAGQSKLSLPKKLQCEMSLTVIHKIKGKGFALKKNSRGHEKKKGNRKTVWSGQVLEVLQHAIGDKESQVRGKG